MDILHIDPKVLIVQIGGFILLLIVFKIFLFKPILGILDARRNEVASQYTSAENERKAAEEFRAQYEDRLSGIEEEMRAKIAEALKEGQTMRDEIISDSRTKADGILTKAQEEIEREKDKALHELRTTVVTMAVGAAGKLIEEKLDPEKHRQLVTRFIDDLDGVRK